MIKFLKNSIGLSLVELLIGSAMVSGIVLVTYSLQKNVTTQLVNIGEQADIIFDQAGAIRAITEDLSFSDPSFNFVNSEFAANQRDDFWTVTDEDLGPRSIDLDLNNCIKFFAIDKSKTLNTVTGKIDRKGTLLVRPSYFYNNRTLMTDPLVYNSSKISSLLNDNLLAISGQFIKISGMVPIFESGASQNYYRDYSLLLQVGSGASVSVVPASASAISFYRNPNPVGSGCTQNNADLDQFLRCLPTPGGGSTSFYVTPIIPITYCFTKSSNRERGYELFRKKGSRNILIASGVEYLKFTRKNSNNPIVNFDLKFCKLHASSGICKK